MLWGKKWTWVISLNTRMHFKDYIYWERVSMHQKYESQPNVGYSVGGINTQWRIDDIQYVEKFQNRLKRVFCCECFTDPIDLNQRLQTSEFKEDPYAERFPNSNLFNYYCPQQLEDDYASFLRGGWQTRRPVSNGYAVHFNQGDGSMLFRKIPDGSYEIMDDVDANYTGRKLDDLPDWVK